MMATTRSGANRANLAPHHCYLRHPVPPLFPSFPIFSSLFYFSSSPSLCFFSSPPRSPLLRLPLMLFFTILLFSLIGSSLSVAPPFDLDNSLIGQPNISCHPDTIEMRFRTKRPFTGKIYVQGHYNNPDCRVDFSQAGGADHDGRGGIRLHHGSCDMDRQRMVRPEGMQFSTVLVISFHPLFVTKTDRAFHINCMYREIDQDVDTGMTVGDVTPANIQNDMPLPICNYTIRKDALDGEVLKYARVGDFIVHRWQCDSDMYGMLVHSCFVEDGQGERVQVIDEKGCHKDSNVLGDPTYSEALNLAYRESYVFKFRDRLGVRFSCEIKLCVKAEDGCAEITPPDCQGGGVRFQNIHDDPVGRNNNNQMAMTVTASKNRVRRQNGGNVGTSGGGRTVVDADLISQYVFVLDEPVEGEDDADTTAQDERRLMQMNRSGGGGRQKYQQAGPDAGGVCLSSPLFGALLIVILFTFCLASAIVGHAICRQYKRSPSMTSRGIPGCPSSPSIGSARSSCSPGATFFMKR